MLSDFFIEHYVTRWVRDKSWEICFITSSGTGSVCSQSKVRKLSCQASKLT